MQNLTLTFSCVASFPCKRSSFTYNIRAGCIRSNGASEPKYSIDTRTKYMYNGAQKILLLCLHYTFSYFTELKSDATASRLHFQAILTREPPLTYVPLYNFLYCAGHLLLSKLNTYLAFYKLWFILQQFKGLEQNLCRDWCFKIMWAVYRANTVVKFCR